MINKNKEVGGSHYSDMKIEPIELITALRLNFVQGCIVKYISRYKSKNGVEDLRKALHYCSMRDIYGCADLYGVNAFALKCYFIINNISEEEQEIICSALTGEFERCGKLIEKLIDKIPC